MTEHFTSDELALVLTVALLGFDDDHTPPIVNVQMPTGRLTVTGAFYESQTNELIIETTAARFRSSPIADVERWITDSLRRSSSTGRLRPPLRDVRLMHVNYDDVGQLKDTRSEHERE